MVGGKEVRGKTLGKALFSTETFLFLHENIMLCVSGLLLEAPLMSTHNVCIHGEIRKIFVG